MLICDWIPRSGLEQDDMRILYKYLTTSLFPRHSEPEVRRTTETFDLNHKCEYNIKIISVVSSLLSWLAGTLLWGQRLQGICCTMGGKRLTSALCTHFLCRAKVRREFGYSNTHVLHYKSNSTLSVCMWMFTHGWMSAALWFQPADSDELCLQWAKLDKELTPLANTAVAKQQNRSNTAVSGKSTAGFQCTRVTGESLLRCLRKKKITECLKVKWGSCSSPRLTPGDSSWDRKPLDSSNWMTHCSALPSRAHRAVFLI